MSTTATEVGSPAQAPPEQASPAHASTDPVAAPPTAPVESADEADTGQPGGASSKTEDKGKAANGKQAKGKAKGKEGKGAGKGSKPGDDAPASGSPSVAAHPRAARSVAQAKSWGGLAGVFIAGYLSLPTDTLAQAGLRALLAGAVCYVATWAGAVFVWRRLVIIELKGREQQLLEIAGAPTQGEPGAQGSSGTPTAGQAGARAA